MNAEAWTDKVLVPPSETETNKGVTSVEKTPPARSFSVWLALMVTPVFRGTETVLISFSATDAPQAVPMGLVQSQLAPKLFPV